MLRQTVPIHRLTVEDVIEMVAAGILDELTRVELVDGVLVEMTPPGPQHTGALGWLTARSPARRRAARRRDRVHLARPRCREGRDLCGDRRAGVLDRRRRPRRRPRAPAATRRRVHERRALTGDVLAPLVGAPPVDLAALLGR